MDTTEFRPYYTGTSRRRRLVPEFNTTIGLCMDHAPWSFHWRRTAWLDAAQPNRERRGPGTCVPRAPLGRSALRIERSRDRACTASTAWIRSCARLARHPMEMERLWRGHSHALPALSQRAITIHTLSLIHQHMRHPNTAETCPREDPVGIVIRDGAPAL